ncbi:ferric enterobactin transport protein FepE [Escherichia coli]|uniref:Ferric enterobactin transport protein FepE n=1 Tax=Escherichia coli TaxID=562 RepID=A0A484VUD5_ECOLX|nr:ferric enterobactin transport protein FepE [Escherichia coli]
MSSLNIKQGSEAHFPEYPLASPSNNEIDLLSLIEVLWRAKKTVMAVVFAFACAGLLISFILPQKMDQLSRHYSRRSHSVAGPGENLYQTPRS